MTEPDPFALKTHAETAALRIVLTTVIGRLAHAHPDPEAYVLSLTEPLHATAETASDTPFEQLIAEAFEELAAAIEARVLD